MKPSSRASPQLIASASERVTSLKAADLSLEPWKAVAQSGVGKLITAEGGKFWLLVFAAATAVVQTATQSKNQQRQRARPQ